MKMVLHLGFRVWDTYFLDTGCVHLISLMWLEDVIASSSLANQGKNCKTFGCTMSADTSLHMTSLPLSSLSSDSGLTLPKRLQTVYKDRWTILLDAFFSSEPAQRVSLGNSFIGTKVEAATVRNACHQHLLIAQYRSLA